MDAKLRDFYLLVITQVFSLIGSRMSGLAIGIWVFNETGNATPLLIVAALQNLPLMLGTSIAGVYADRLNRKMLLVVSDIGQAAATFALLIAFSSGVFELWQLYVATLVGATFMMIQQPVNAASVTTMVPDSHRDMANTLRQLGEPAAGFVAPILAGLLYGPLGVEGLIGVDLVTFVLAVTVILLFVDIPQPARTTTHEDGRSESVWRELRSALAFLWDYRPILWVVLFAALINFIIVGPLTLLTPYILALTGSEALVGVILGLVNVGMIVGGIVFSMYSTRIRPRIYGMLGGIGVLGVLMMVMGIARSPLMLGITSFFLMTTLPMVNALAFSVLQVKVPPDMQGRVFAMVMQLSVLATPLSLIIAGPLVDEVFEPAVGTDAWATVAPIVGETTGSGMGLFILLSGMGLLMSLLIFALQPSIRNLEADLPDYKAVEAEAMPQGDMAPAGT